MWGYNGSQYPITWESLTDGLNHVLNKLWPFLDLLQNRSDAQPMWCADTIIVASMGARLDAILPRRLREFGAELFIDTYSSVEDGSAMDQGNDLVY